MTMTAERKAALMKDYATKTGTPVRRKCRWRS